MAKLNYDHLFKVLILGDSAVGKSCILTRFSDDVFNHSFLPTIGIDFKMKTVEVDGKKVKLQIWDTAGQERFNRITEAYYRTAKGVLFVYDITNGQSFDNIGKWLRNLDDHNSDDTVKFIVGNKCDLAELRVITHIRGIEMASKFGLPFYETSAKNNINIETVFHDMARVLVNKNQNVEVAQEIQFNNNNREKKASMINCC